MTKRIFSILLALALVLALAMPAMAEESYTLTINDSENGRIYTYYQVFTGREYTSNSGTIFTDAAFGSGIDSADLCNALDLTGENATAVKAVETLSGIDGKEAAKIIKNCLSSESHNMPATADGKTTAEVASGYYFVEETTPNLGDGQIASSFILDVVNDVVANTKRSNAPEYDKWIVENNTNVNHTDKAIGEIITFKISGIVPSDYDRYETYNFIFHDTMDKGLTFVETVSVMVGSTALIKNEDYTFTQSTEDVNKTKLVYDFGNIIPKTKINENDEIVVTYTAKLNENAVIAGDGNLNAFHIEYSRKPGTEETTTTSDKYAVIFTFEANGEKVDKNDPEKKLQDAKFVITNNAGTEYLAQDANKNITWVESIDDATVLTSAADGKFGIEGLDAGNYKLVETNAPNGYNLLTAPVPFTINPTYNDHGNVNTSITLLTNTESIAPVIVVENSAGTTLPETGGIGTTIFYVIGGLLMAAAVVLLVAKKRTVNE